MAKKPTKASTKATLRATPKPIIEQKNKKQPREQFALIAVIVFLIAAGAIALYAIKSTNKVNDIYDNIVNLIG